MPERRKEDAREAVVERARQYRDVVRVWDGSQEETPERKKALWRVLMTAEQALFAAIDAFELCEGHAGWPEAGNERQARD